MSEAPDKTRNCTAPDLPLDRSLDIPNPENDSNLSSEGNAVASGLVAGSSASMHSESSPIDGSRAASSWWGSWGRDLIQTVKDKSAVTLEMVRKDLSEFVEVIQCDTSQVISNTASKLQDDAHKEEPCESSTAKYTKSVKKGLSTLLHKVSDMVAFEPDDSSEEQIVLSDDKFSLESYSRKQVEIHEMQRNPASYCEEFDDPLSPFADWVSNFDMDGRRTDMSTVLVQNPDVRAIYSQLVPKVVSHCTFWQRYFYRVHLINKEEERREALLARVTGDEGVGDTLGWDDDNDDDIEVVPRPYEPALNSGHEARHAQLDKIVDVDREDSSSAASSNWGDIVEPDEAGCLSRLGAQASADRSGKELELIDIDVACKQLSEAAITSEKISCLSQGNNNKSHLARSHETITEAVDVGKWEQCAEFGSFTQGVTQGVAVDVASRASPVGESDVVEADPQCRGEIEEASMRPKSSAADYMESEFQRSSSPASSSWLSIDDVIKVKRVGDLEAQEYDSSGKLSTGSSGSGVLVSKSDANDGDDLELDDEVDLDVNEEELAKMVQDIKEKGSLEDDDWENW